MSVVEKQVEEEELEKVGSSLLEVDLKAVEKEEEDEKEEVDKN